MKPRATLPAERCNVVALGAGKGSQEMAAERTPRKRSGAKNNVSQMPASPLRADEIARRAYEIFLARGREQGRDLDDWLQAELELGKRTVRWRARS